MSIVSLRGMLLLILTGCTLLARAEEPKVGFEQGAFQALSAQIKPLLQLKLDGEKLGLDRQSWEEPFKGKTQKEMRDELIKQMVQRGLPQKWAERRVEQQLNAPGIERLFQTLQQAAGPSGMSSSTSGSNRRVSFRGGKLSGELEVLNGSSVRVTLSESQAPQRSVEVLDNGAGGCRITISNQDGNMLFALVQGQSGELSIADIRGKIRKATGGKSFLSFYRSEKQYVEKELFPLLEHLNVGLPTTPYSSQVLAAVASRLVKLTREQEDQAYDLIVDLENDDFETREQATKQLAEQFNLFYPILVETLQEENLSPETRNRLERIVAAHPERQRLEKFILALGLLEDVSYLVEILPDLDEAQRPVVTAQLETLTEQDFGLDVAAWQRWAKQQTVDGQEE